MAKSRAAAPATTLDDALAKLKSLGDPRVKALNIKRGSGENQFGVKLGDIRKVADKIGTDHALAAKLWATEIIDARLLGILLIAPDTLPRAELDAMVRSVGFAQVADWLNAYVVKDHPDREALRQVWMTDNNPWAARAGWSLTAGRVARSPDGLDLPALLDRIEAEMQNAPSATQWAMNNCLAGIGINFPKYRKRAIAIAEKIGLYRDFPVSKGCTSPFAPMWINEMVRRQT